MDSVLWEVVRDEHGKVVRPVAGTDPVTKSAITGQEVVFRTKAKNGVVVTKKFRLFPNTHGLEVELTFESPDKERSVVYNLLGPHGIPIEGEWYTGTFRDVVFGQLKGKAIEIVTHAASDVAGAAANSIDNTALPLVFAGVENQYFAILVEPNPLPTGESDRWDSKTTALILHKNEQAIQKSDVGVRISSKPIYVGPNRPVSHNYRVFAGPKTSRRTAPITGPRAGHVPQEPVGIPFAADIARFVITPTLGFTYEVTARVARLFGRTDGNYGIAIILLTVLVRGLMFPIGRKQALAAQKMQQLQPLLKELQDKFKDDKERLTKETVRALQEARSQPGRRLPARLDSIADLCRALAGAQHQLSVAACRLSCGFATCPRRTCSFDFHSRVPFLGNWFNVLPFVVVGLMLVQTKLFAPPATTPEAEMQQKTMKYMMIFMGFMFYKVPSGLGLYFITSSLWAIGERLLLAQDHARPAGLPTVARPTVRNERRQRVRIGKGFWVVYGNGGGAENGVATVTEPRSRLPAGSASSWNASSTKPARIRPTARWSMSATARGRRERSRPRSDGPGPSPETMSLPRGSRMPAFQSRRSDRGRMTR